MAQVNFGAKTINCKIVYYGPEGSGKTQILERVHRKAPKREGGGRLVSINSEAERTLFFEYMPMELGKFDGLQTTFHLYTVPGRPGASATRQSVLRNVDVVIFVADSDPDRMDANLEAFEHLHEDLREVGLNPTSVPVIFQWHKRDLPFAIDTKELERALAPEECHVFPSSLVTGAGVLAALKRATLIALEQVGERFGLVKDGTRQIARPRIQTKVLPQRSKSTRLRAVQARVAELSQESKRQSLGETGKFQVVGLGDKKPTRRRGLTSFFSL